MKVVGFKLQEMGLVQVHFDDGSHVFVHIGLTQKGIYSESEWQAYTSDMEMIYESCKPNKLNKREVKMGCMAIHEIAAFVNLIRYSN